MKSKVSVDLDGIFFPSDSNIGSNILPDPDGMGRVVSVQSSNYPVLYFRGYEVGGTVVLTTKEHDATVVHMSDEAFGQLVKQLTHKLMSGSFVRIVE